MVFDVIGFDQVEKKLKQYMDVYVEILDKFVFVVVIFGLNKQFKFYNQVYVNFC